jgi:putative thioredoxin
MNSFGSAFDLSSLQTPKNSADQVSGWLVPADEAVLRRYLELSERVPVIMLVSDSTDDSAKVRAALSQILAASEGRFAGLEISIETQPQLAAAVAVQQAPAALALIAGQPAPLFRGVASLEQITQVLAQVLQHAAQSNITGRVSIGETKEKPINPLHQAALEALDRGDLDAALQGFQKLVTEYPADSEAKAGLNQVKLMLRLQSKPVGELETFMAGADQFLVAGKATEALGLLLDRFAVDFENRDPIRERLLELFSLIGDSEDLVLQARRRLTSLMF